MSPIRYLKEVNAQMKRVKWPSFRTFINSFSVILIIIVIASVVLYLESYAGVSIMNQLRDSFVGVSPTVDAASLAHFFVR